jgi:RPA family protein
MDIKSLYTGQYIVQEGFNPNYIEINGERISRVRVLGTVIDKFLSEDGNYGTITLDDGTDTIRAKAFQDLRIIEPIEKGFVVELIGKIREYNAERYLQPEIIVKVEDPNFEVLRKLELKKMLLSPTSVSENKPPAEIKAKAPEEEKLPEPKKSEITEELEEETEKIVEEKTEDVIPEKPKEKITPGAEEGIITEELPKEESLELLTKTAQKTKQKPKIIPEQKKLV